MTALLKTGPNVSGEQGVFSLLFGLAVCMIVLLSPAQASVPDNTAAGPALSATLQGLPDGATVTVSNPGQSLSPQSLVVEGGSVTLPSAFILPQSSQKTQSYSLQIDHEGRVLDILFNVDLTTGKLTISGKGAEEFSKVFMQCSDEKVETKADWSGAFEAIEAATLQNLIKSQEGLQLAFRGNSIFGAAAEDQQPLTVQVFSATGGGGPSGQGVNDYSTSGSCGDNKISVCTESVTDNQLDQVVENYVTALSKMTAQLSGVMMHFTAMIGTFFDAEHQLDVQRETQMLVAEAHKDYHPGQGMCKFGTFIKSMPRIEEIADHSTQALNAQLLETYTNIKNSASTQGDGSYLKSRLQHYRQTYCDPVDNNNALQDFCENTKPERRNRDIDYPRTVMMDKSLNINYRDGTLTEAEEDVLALARNLYWHEAMVNADGVSLRSRYEAFQDWRHIAAVNTVAHRSFAEIVGLKTRGMRKEELEARNLSQPGWLFMKAYLKEMGWPEGETVLEYEDTEGTYRPKSYFEQMEVLTKKIYQNPDFYTNLYDKPANVNRMKVSMEALKNMQLRDHYESALRREMLLSLMVEQGLKKHVDEVNGALTHRP